MLRNTMLAALTLVAACVVATAQAAGDESTAAGEKLVIVMHENLARLNHAYGAISRDDYARVALEANGLERTARSLQDVDLRLLRLEPAKDDAFDAYLAVQAEAASAIAAGARQGDPAKVLAGIERLVEKACVGCHADFRIEDPGRTAPVLSMRALLSSVQSINRGIVMNDFPLVAREAREIGSIAHTFTWSQVIEAMFLVKDPARQREFRDHLEVLIRESIEIERGARDQEPAAIANAQQRMLEQGCIACHTAFRKESK